MGHPFPWSATGKRAIAIGKIPEGRWSPTLRKVREAWATRAEIGPVVLFRLPA